MKPVFNLLSSAYDEYRAKTQDKLESTQNAILKLFAAMMIFFLLFCGAILLYILFYLMYMPAVTNVKPAYMQYNKICDADSRTCERGGSMSSYHTFPQAHLQLTKKQLMMVGQPYIITVKLELPETPRNQDLGMFMICIDMKDKESALKAHSCRSTMLRYRSPWLQKLKTFLLIPFYLTGWDEESQVLDIEMFTNYIDNRNSVTDIYVEIQSKIVEFYSVTVQISAHFTGLRYLIFNFPVVSAIVGIAVNLITLMFITFVIWYHYNYEMEWVEDARRKYVGDKSSLNVRKIYNDDEIENNEMMERKGSSSISTTDENVSIIDNSDDKFEIEDDLLLFDKDSEIRHRGGVGAVGGERDLKTEE